MKSWQQYYSIGYSVFSIQTKRAEEFNKQILRKLVVKMILSKN